MLKKQLRPFIFPLPSVFEYSNSRELWQNMVQTICHVCLGVAHGGACALPLLHQTGLHECRGSLSAKDREKALALNAVCEGDLRDELPTLRSSRYPDSLLPYVTSVMEHVRAVINLRIPIESNVSFPFAPTWNDPPIDDDWQRILYREV